MNRLLFCVGLFSFSFTVFAEDQISRIGNEIVASPSGVNVDGAIFLLNDVSLEEGVAFAFSAFFRTDETIIIIQIWRPINDTDENSDASNFRLIGELPVTPSVSNAREDIYFEAKLRQDECVRVRKGDRVGVYFVESPGAIAYVFNSRDPQAFSNTLKNTSDPYVIGDVVSFDSLVFPYDFSLSAYIDTDLSKYNDSELNGDLIRCPSKLLIPSEKEVTPVPLTTTTPAPGATGATGPRGFQGAAGSIGPEGKVGPQGEMGATGADGPMGTNGTDGDDGGMGATGYTGPEGGMGATGMAGPKGDTGKVGPAGPAGKSANEIGEVSDESKDLLKEGIILGFLIWLIIITILLIILIILICVAWRRRKEAAERADVAYDAETPKYDNAPRGRLTSDNPSMPDPAYANMKGETESQYSLDTIDRDGKPVNSNHIYDNNAMTDDVSKDEVANY